LARHGFQSSSTSNACVVEAFPASDLLSVVTRGGCSCDLAGRPAADFDEAAERLKYRKKGWSASKIERAVLGKRPNERANYATFRETLASVVRATGEARIMAHWFSGPIETELVLVQPRIALSLDQYLARAGAYEDDTLHDLRAG
jgi:hypothetical protein